MVEPGTTGLPVPGTSVFFTVKFGTGFVTVDVQWFGSMHGPVVMVAVFFTLVVSVGETLAVKVTLTEWPAGSVTWITSVFGWAVVTVTEQLPVAGIVLHASVVGVRVRLDGRGSFKTADPAPTPTFLTVIV